jgi:hypothetical protein
MSNNWICLAVSHVWASVGWGAAAASRRNYVPNGPFTFPG